MYSEDSLGFVKDTQDEQWQKFCGLYPNEPETKFLERVGVQLNKADPNVANKEMRTFGTLGVLRNELRIRGTRFKLCQFKPEHNLNADSLARYQKNRLRVLPELVYSPWADGWKGKGKSNGAYNAALLNFAFAAQASGGRPENSIVLIDTAALLANDTDVDLTGVSTVTNVSNDNGTSTVVLSANNTVTYDPNGEFDYLSEGEAATDTFTYTIDDGSGGTDTATVTIEIVGIA